MFVQQGRWAESPTNLALNNYLIIIKPLRINEKGIKEAMVPHFFGALPRKKDWSGRTLLLTRAA
jgi:hypothetical protein